MAETLRAAVERFLGLWAKAEEPLASVSVIASIHHCPYTGPPLGAAVDALRDALALPDDPRDAKLRAFDASMTPEKWAALCGDVNEGMATDEFEAARVALNALREALTKP